MDYLVAFAVGGAICAVAQVVMEHFRLTPAHVLVGLVVIGAVLSGFGVYQRLVDATGAGALVPVSGFGSAIVQGVIKDTKALGWEGLFTGVFRLTSLALAAAVVAGVVSSLFVRPRR